LGKPTDEADALRILQLLSGQTHRVLTAVALQKGSRRVSAVSASWVRFAPMTLTQIKTYVATGEPMGKAGAYGVQGRAAAHIEQIRGSYSGIMGLPLFETARLLRTLGVRC
jgi:septum formation protein